MAVKPNLDVITQDESLKVDKDIINRDMTNVSPHLGGKHLGMTFPRVEGSDSSDEDEDTKSDSTDEVDTLYQYSDLLDSTFNDHKNEKPGIFADIRTKFSLFDICQYHAHNECLEIL